MDFLTTKDTKLDNIELSVWGLREMGEAVRACESKLAQMHSSKELREAVRACQARLAQKKGMGTKGLRERGTGAKEE